MRATLVVSLAVLIAPVAGLAQTTPAPSAVPGPSATPGPSAAPAPPAASAAPRSPLARGGGITRDQYIERAVERAKRAAGKRFDKLDVNHDGVVGTEERGAARAARAKRKSSMSQ